MTVSDTQAVAVGSKIGTDTLLSIEKLIGGAGSNDVLDLSAITGDGVVVNGDEVPLYMLTHAETVSTYCCMH